MQTDRIEKQKAGTKYDGAMLEIYLGPQISVITGVSQLQTSCIRFSYLENLIG